MNECEIVQLYLQHVQAYPGANPATGAPWTHAERMADIIRKLKKARALLAVVKWSALDADAAAIAEVKAETGF